MSRVKHNPDDEGEETSEGIYYLIWMKDVWFFYPVVGHVAHHAVWREKVAPMLAEVYGVELDHRLLIPWRSMPRGRIRQDGKSWVIEHGNDTDGLYNMRELISEIVSAFGLTKEHRLGLVRADYWDHEEMLAGHQMMIQKVTGNIKGYPQE